MIGHGEPSEFYQRMRPDYDALHRASMEAWVKAFIDALTGPGEPKAPRQLLTASELRHLDFVRYRLETGRLLP